MSPLEVTYNADISDFSPIDFSMGELTQTNVIIPLFEK